MRLAHTARADQTDPHRGRHPGHMDLAAAFRALGGLGAHHQNQCLCIERLCGCCPTMLILIGAYVPLLLGPLLSLCPSVQQPSVRFGTSMTSMDQQGTQPTSRVSSCLCHYCGGNYTSGHYTALTHALRGNYTSGHDKWHLLLAPTALPPVASSENHSREATDSASRAPSVHRFCL